MSNDKINTRSKTKLKLTIEKDSSTPPFTPPHRSTELFAEEPFQRSAKTPRSPTGPLTSSVIEKSIFVFPASASEETNDKTIQPGHISPSSKFPPAAPPQPQTPVQIEATPRNEGTIQNRPIRRITTAQNMADVTLSQSLTAAKTPAKPKFICPPTYNPCSSSASSFVKNYERTAAANGWDDTLRIGYLETFLEGAANLWFQRYKEREENQEKTWSEVKKDFLEEFESKDLKRMLERQLYERRQKPEESIKSYYYELQNLFGEYDATFNLNEFRKFFENGIRRDLYQSYRLIVNDNINWDDFKVVINKLEDITHPPLGVTQNINTGNTRTQCSCTCNQQQGSRHWNFQRSNQPPARQNNFQRNFQPQVNRNQYNPQPQRNNFNAYRPQQTQVNGRNFANNRTNIPNTRTHDGRPKCYICNRIGHYANTCNASRENRYPNANGRHS